MDKTIMIVKQETVSQSWARDASTWALAVGVILPGVYLESNAMQWTGAMFAFLAILLKASGMADAHKFDIEGAQKRLDEIKHELAGNAQ